MKISERSRKLYDELGQGFNTWDIHSVTAHVLLPEKLRVNIGFITPHLNQYATDILWDNVESFGEHSIDGSYTEVFVRFNGGLYQVESSAGKKELAIRVTPRKTQPDAYLSLEAGELFGRSFQFRYESPTSILAEKEESVFAIRSLSEDAAIDWDPVTCPHLIAPADATRYFTVNSAKSPAEIDALLAARREEWLQSTITASGPLGEGLDAMRRSLLWNMVYDFRNRRVVTPVSRNWCGRNSAFGDYVLFDWDTFFAGLQYGLIDKRLAYSTVFSILEEMTPDGMIPNFGCGTGASYDRSEPQVGAMCVWKLYVQYGEKWFLKECFDTLLKWNEWRFRERDYNKDGLLELGSDPTRFEGRDDSLWCYNQKGQRQAAMWESGLDNSPMWDRAKFNEELHCIELSYVGLNALMVADCEFLEKMARELGYPEEEAKLRERRIALSGKIEAQLWDATVDCYRNRNWDGTFDPCLSLTHFYTITAGLGKEGRLEKMLEKHLLNPAEFWGDYMIPNVSRDDPGFPDQDYWRGRIWGPTNFLVGEGILRIGKMDIWDHLAEKGLKLFLDCWKGKGVVGENYNAITGEAAEPGKASDRFYHWGALLVYMAVQRKINFNEWTDSVEYPPAADWLEEIRNIPVREQKISC